VPNLTVNLDAAAYAVSTLATLCTDMSLMQIWALAFSVFLCATIALILRVSTIPPVPLPPPRPPAIRPKWQLVCMFGSKCQIWAYRLYPSRGSAATSRSGASPRTPPALAARVHVWSSVAEGGVQVVSHLGGRVAQGAGQAMLATRVHVWVRNPACAIRREHGGALVA
jgi:hypothetical protein